MGTMDPALKIKANPSRDGYGDNPRCLRRDVNNNVVTTSLAPANLAGHITSNSAILGFQNTLQNDQQGRMAIHSSGHYSIWGDPGGMYMCFVEEERKMGVWKERANRENR
jgi:tyrosinase